MSATQAVKAKALELGFNKVGIAKAASLDEEGQRLREWLRRGYHGTMGWMERNMERRVDPRLIIPGAQSVIAVALNYHTHATHTDAPEAGKVSRYAWGDDYHTIVTKKLTQLWSWMQRQFPGIDGRYYVDTGPVMDKVWAERAGIGWIGKHTNVITPDIGSWVFLGEIITTLELDYDEPALDHCGTCTACIEACPTGAIVEEYVVDSNKCISYLTIEHRGPIPDDLSARFQNWIYGCDICQDVCPWNEKFAVTTDEEGFRPRSGNLAPMLANWENMSDEEFRLRFKGSPVKRTRSEGIRRNVRAVLQHSREAKGTF
jgi:epoxyqueuosine reductase